jgi:hypothetical protein
VAEASFSGSSFTNNKLSELASRGIIFGQNSNSKSLNLIKGNVLFTPESDISVQTNAGTAYIPRGAAAWIVHNGASVAVYDLHDSVRSGRIKVVAGNKELSLSPGSQAVLSKDQTASFDSLNAGNTIAYSNVREGKLGAGTKIFVADFSIPHGLASISVVRNLLESPDAAQRKVAWTMIKDAAILNDLAGSDFQ